MSWKKSGRFKRPENIKMKIHSGGKDVSIKTADARLCRISLMRIREQASIKIVIHQRRKRKTGRRTINMTNTINTENAGNIDIKVIVTLMQNQKGCIKANASVIFNDAFKVTGIRIGISHKGKVFVFMPDYKTGHLDDNGKDIYQDIAYPVTKQFRQKLYDVIVKEYQVAIEREKKEF